MTEFDGRALANEYRGLVESGGSEPAAPEPAGSTPADPAAPPTGDATPPASAQPAQAPSEGSTPEAQPPASAAPASGLAALRSRYGEDEKVASEFFGLEGRMSAAARKIKELEAALAAKPATETPAAPAAAAVQAQPAQPAAPRQDVTPAPVHPAAEGATPPELEQRIQAAVAEDSECVSLHADYHATKQQIEVLVKVDSAGRPIGGELPELDEQIYILSTALDNAKRARAGLHELDEFQREDLQKRLNTFEAQKASKELQLDRLVTKRDRLADRFDERVGRYREHFRGEHDAQRQEAERQEAIEQGSKEFVSEWEGTSSAVLKTLAVPEDLQADILEVAREAAMAKMAGDPNYSIKKGELYGFIERIAKRELDRYEKHHRIKSAEYAATKRADVSQPTPKGPGAVAAPLPTDRPGLDWEEKLNADLRAERKSAMAAAR